MQIKPVAVCAVTMLLLAGCATETTTESSVSGEGATRAGTVEARDAAMAAQRAAEEAAQAARQAAQAAEEAAKRAEAAYNRSLRKGGPAAASSM